MDSPLISRLFKQLFTHRVCQAVRPRLCPSPRLPSARRTQVRCYSRRNDQDADAPRNESHWQQRTDVFPQDMSAEYAKYPMVTADQLRGRRERPRRVKMLTRDFIEGLNPPLFTAPVHQLTSCRFSIQPLIWLLLETGSNFYTWRPIHFQRASR
jgi:hypothetical protein